MQELNLSKCKHLENFPHPCELPSLRALNLEGCERLVSIPWTVLQGCSNLRRLDLSHCTRLPHLPTSIGRLTGRQERDLSHCSQPTVRGGGCGCGCVGADSSQDLLFLAVRKLECVCVCSVVRRVSD